MANNDILNQLKEIGMDGYGSFALYTDQARADLAEHNSIKSYDLVFPTMSDDELAKAIKPKYMLVGLNVADRNNAGYGSWSNFHDNTSKSHDRNVMKIICGTKYFGSYMTDIIKDFPETNSGKVLTATVGMRRTKENAQRLYDSLEIFQQELDITAPEEIILFGDVAFHIFHLAIQGGLLDLPDNTKVVETPHYSSQQKGFNNDNSMYARFTGTGTDVMDSGKFAWHTVAELKQIPAKLKNKNTQI